jgi:VanZ family protein
MIRFLVSKKLHFLERNYLGLLPGFFSQFKIVVFTLLASFFLQSAVISAQDSSNIDSIKLKPKPFLYQDFQIAKLNSKIKYVREVKYPVPQRLNYNSLMLYGGITLASAVAVHIYQSKAWWYNQNSHFHIQEDNTYALQIDKYGHFYGAHLLGHIFSSTLEASNVDLKSSYQYGALLSFLYQMYVEIEDGFGPNWGFSPGDALADLLGSSYFLAQYYFPVLHNFSPRLSYWPTEKVLSGHTNAIIIDDYEGQRYWVAMKMKKLLPDEISKYWPSFLMLSLGTSARDLDGSGGGHREYYLAFDIDYDVLPLHGEFGQWIKNTLDYFHLPMPGIRISPNFAGFAFLY